MKRALKFSAALACAGVLVPAIAWANPVQLVPAGSFGNYATLSGGEFTFQVVQPPSGTPLPLTAYAGVAMDQDTKPADLPNFQTFCVDNLGVYINDTYTATLGDTTFFGQTLTRAAAFLYFEFATGAFVQGAPTLAHDNYYDYANTTANGRGGGAPGGNPQSSAALLQTALWYYMNVGGLSFDPTNPYEELVAAQGWANPFAANHQLAGYYYDVDVMVLTGDIRGNIVPVQSQLYLFADGHDLVPDGGLTVAMLGIGLTGLGALGRKLRQ